MIMFLSYREKKVFLGYYTLEFCFNIVVLYIIS